MRKLRLDPDTLQVQSFATRDTGTFPFGTVHAGQKEPTGVHDPQCSVVLPCESKLGCSEVATCQPTHNAACQSKAIPCVSDAECPREESSPSSPSRPALTVPIWCRPTRDDCQPCQGPSVMAACPDP
jgi:hypothetical protein